MDRIQELQQNHESKLNGTTMSEISSLASDFDDFDLTASPMGLSPNGTGTDENSLPQKLNATYEASESVPKTPPSLIKTPMTPPKAPKISPRESEVSQYIPGSPYSSSCSSIESDNSLPKAQHASPEVTTLPIKETSPVKTPIPSPRTSEFDLETPESVTKTSASPPGTPQLPLRTSLSPETHDSFKISSALVGHVSPRTPKLSPDSSKLQVKISEGSPKTPEPQKEERESNKSANESTKQVRIDSSVEIDNKDRVPKTPFRRSRKVIDTPVRRSARLAAKKKPATLTSDDACKF